MDKLTVHYGFFTYHNTLWSGDAVEWNGLLWSIRGYKWLAKRANPDDIEYIQIECKPVDEDMSFRCEARLRFGNSLRHDMNFRFNHLLSDKIKRSKSFDTLPRSARIFDKQFSVEIAIKAFEVVPRYFFELKDPLLTDIELIVGDKKIYTSKHILALNSTKFYEMIYGKNEPVNQIEIEDVDYDHFRRFLEVLHGYNYARIKKEDIYQMCGLAIQFDSKTCLDQCVISYLHLTYEEKFHFKHDVQDSRCTIGKDYLVPIAAMPENDFQYRHGDFSKKNRPSPTIYSKIIDCKDENMTKFLVVDGIPFKVEHHQNQWSSYREIKIECLYKDATDLWKCVVLLNYTGRNFNPSTEYFTADRRHLTTSWCKTSSLYMGIEAFWSACPEEDMNLETPKENLTDVVLSVGDKKYHVSKQILANASTYFYSLFYSNFAEKDQSEVELKEVDAAEFEEFLQHIYYPKRFIEESKLESLLQLSQFYNAQFIHKKCVDYILFDMRATDAQKMVLAVKHNLDGLLKNLAARIETVHDFEQFSKLDGFDELDEKTIALVKPVEKPCLKRKLDAESSNN